MLHKLSKEIKELVVRGVYSLFELKEAHDGYFIVLVTSSNAGLLLNNDGSKSKPISNLDLLKLGKLITVNDVSIPDCISVSNLVNKKLQENIVKKSIIITNTAVGISRLEKEILKTQISEIREVLKK